MDYSRAEHAEFWEEKFQTRDWGRYPAEDLVRFISRNFPPSIRSTTTALDLGCGVGANAWFLYREGFKVSAIDQSKTAIAKLADRIKDEPTKLNSNLIDLRVGSFERLPFEDESFDVVVDICSVGANIVSVIQATLTEVHRVLKPGGLVYSRFISMNATGVLEGTEIEPYTFTNNPRGSTAGMGPVHFVDEARLRTLFSDFDIIAVNRLFRTEVERGYDVEDFALSAKKPSE